MMTYNQPKFACKKVSSEATVVIVTFSFTLVLFVCLFLHNTPPHDDAVQHNPPTHTHTHTHNTPTLLHLQGGI